MTHFSRLDSKAKGYRKGQSDLDLRIQDGGRIDIIAIELQTPNGSNPLSIHQEEYIELLHDLNVLNSTSNNYADIIDFIASHYKQMRNRAKPLAHIDFPTRREP